MEIPFDLHKQIFEKLNEGVFILKENEIYYANSWLADLLGYELSELIGLNVMNFFLKEDLAKLEKRSQNRLDGVEEPSIYELALTRKNGEIVHGQVNIGVYEHEGEQLAYGAYKDLSSYKKAEQAELDIDSIINNLPDVFYRVNMEGIITMISPSCLESIGYTTDEMVGKPMESFYTDPAQRALITEAIVAGGGRATHVQVSMRRKDGGLIWVSTNSYIRVDATGQPFCLEGNARNITELKDKEKELIEARELAVKADETKSNFLAVMSHELRTPMNGVLGMAQLLKTQLTTEEQHYYCDVILDSGQALVNLLSNILDFSKIEAGKLVVKKEFVNLEAVIAENMRLFSGSALAKNIQLSYRVDTDVNSELLGDYTLLGQIFSNLIGNAIKFTESGAIEVRVSVELDEGACQQIRFDVKDTGIGIPEDSLPFLFDSFHQVDNSSTRKFRGTGLGLSIVKNVAEVLGGSISVTSEEGKGSVFTILLTFDKLEPTSKEVILTPHIKKLVVEDTLTQNFSGKCILLVEDDPVNRQVARAGLKSLQAEIQIAENGQIAVQMAGERKYDLIIMDLLMPVMEGFEATTLIRKEGANQDTPILAMSAKSFEADRTRCFEVGMNDYLSKPININLFQEKVSGFLNTKES